MSKVTGFTRGDTFFRCEYDLDEIKAATETDSYLRLIVKKYSELFFKSGYVYRGVNDKAIEYLKTRFRIMSYMMDESFDILLRETGYDLVKFSNAFWVKSRKDTIPFIKAKGIVSSEKCVVRYSRVDPATMQIKFNDKGEVTGYRQVVNGQEKKFSVEDVIHFTFDRNPGSEWGVPRWIAALEDIRILRKVEGDVIALIYRYAIPFFHAKVGLAQQGLFGTQREIDDLTDKIEHMPSDAMLVTNERVQIDAVGASEGTINMQPYLIYFQDRVFTGLNSSAAMMGRGGAKQDADSMEEQVHNAVKDNQASFALQFQHAVISEILLEGGFNPIVNEDDEVFFCFNEINLDTKVKTENHEINKFQSNVITFEEMRDSIGYRKDSVDEERLFNKMFEQANAMEQINTNHENAMELQCLTSDNAMELAKLNAKLSAGTATTSSQSSSTTPSTDKDKGKKYAKKNTANGKTKKTARKNGTVISMDKPSNQYGTHSVKIKESVCHAIDEISSSVSSGETTLTQAKTKLLLVMKDTSKAAARDGFNAALAELGKDAGFDIGIENDTLLQFSRDNLTSYFSDIEKVIGNTTDRDAVPEAMESQKYRLHLMQDLIYRKAYWNSYAKAYALNGVDSLQVHCAKDSRHSEEHDGRIINTKNFRMHEIPGFSANCNCYLTPLQKENQEGQA